MTSKCKNGGDTFLQNVIKTEVFCYAWEEEIKCMHYQTVLYYAWKNQPKISKGKQSLLALDGYLWIYSCQSYQNVDLSMGFLYRVATLSLPILFYDFIAEVVLFL